MDDKVCVIGIFGKGSVGYRSKAVHVNSAIDKEVFKVGVLIVLRDTCAWEWIEIILFLQIDFLDKSLKKNEQLPVSIEYWVLSIQF